MPDEIPHSPTSSQTCGYQDNGCVEIQKSSLTCPSENFESESRSGPDESDSTMSSTSSTLSIVPDQRKFASDKYECLFPRLYFSSSKKNGYVCKYFELFSSWNGTQKDMTFITQGVTLRTHPTRKLS